MKQKKWTTQELITTGMLAAVAGVLMSLEISFFPNYFPFFYKLDFSDVPSIIALFSMGPASAICVEVIKIIIKLITVGTNSMYVGELANLLGIILYVAPVYFVYTKGGKTTKSALWALAINVPVRIVFSCFLNACISLPLYAKAGGMDLNEVILMVSETNKWVTNLPTFLILFTIPFNLIKISLNYILGYALYDRLKSLRVIKRSDVKA